MSGPALGPRVVGRDDRALLRLGGEDRARFLNGQITCDVASLGSGRGVYGYFVGLKGRVEADCAVMADTEALWLDVPATRAESIVERLRKYAILDRVEVEPTDRVALGVFGAGAHDAVAEALETSVRPADEPWSLASQNVPGTSSNAASQNVPGTSSNAASQNVPGTSSSVLWVRHAALDGSDGTVPVALLWIEADAVDNVRARLEASGVVALDGSAWTLARVEAGRPRYGDEVGDEHFPQEIADPSTLESAVSYTKGCYLGQEVVARIHYRGGVQRRLAGVTVDGAAIDAPIDPASLTGAMLRLDGRSVGRLGTVVDLPRLGLVGLAVVHQRAADGAAVEVAPEDEDDGTEARPTITARVVGLPFVGG